MSINFDMTGWRRRYMLMTEAGESHPMYDPDKHKTILKGAIDYELSADGKSVVFYLPFEEEEEMAVAYAAPVKEVEDFIASATDEDVRIESEEDLQMLDSDEVESFIFHPYYGKFGEKKNQIKEVDEEDFSNSYENYYDVSNSVGYYYFKVKRIDFNRANRIAQAYYEESGIDFELDDDFQYVTFLYPISPEAYDLVQDLVYELESEAIDVVDHNLEVAPALEEDKEGFDLHSFYENSMYEEDLGEDEFELEQAAKDFVSMYKDDIEYFMDHFEDGYRHIIQMARTKFPNVPDRKIIDLINKNL